MKVFYRYRKYYLKGLWKITWVFLRNGAVVKHYEKREGKGRAFVHVRSIRCD